MRYLPSCICTSCTMCVKYDCFVLCFMVFSSAWIRKNSAGLQVHSLIALHKFDFCKGQLNITYLVFYQIQNIQNAYFCALVALLLHLNSHNLHFGAVIFTWLEQILCFFRTAESDHLCWSHYFVIGLSLHVHRVIYCERLNFELQPEVLLWCVWEALSVSSSTQEVTGTPFLYQVCLMRQGNVSSNVLFPSGGWIRHRPQLKGLL